ncbi:MAG TPA: type II secretion system protein GspK [Candidatus Eisenbacteria bacterium]|nr:type II secretion system protein GspK [Candidatus Eisenbacteria bacterium]
MQAKLAETLNERGVALIVVLWIFIFLFAVAFDFSLTVRDEASAAHRFNDETQGYYLALAGFQRGLYDLMHQAAGVDFDDLRDRRDLFDGEWREGKLTGGSYRVRFVDEGGKININRADEATLHRIFLNLGIEEPRRTILVDSILDWRDADDLHRVNGAESEYYRSLHPAYTAKNGPFETLEDLLWVRGMNAALFYGASDALRRETPAIPFRRIFTVDSAIDRINLRTASAEVIHALLGMPLDQARAFIEERRKLSGKSIGDLLRLLGIGAQDAMLRMFVFSNPTVISVEAEGRPGESSSGHRLRGVVRTSGARGFELLRWTDRDVASVEN